MKLEKYLIISREKPNFLDKETILYTDPERLLISPFFSKDKTAIDEALAYKKYLWGILNNPSGDIFDVQLFGGTPLIWIKQPTNYKISTFLHKIANDIRSLFRVRLVINEPDENIDVLARCITYLVNNPRLDISNKLIHEDLLSLPKGMVCQNVNCQKKMGAGLALAIRTKYPQVYQDYMDKIWELGDTQFVEINNDLVFCNLAGQELYGTNKRQTDFLAIENGLKSVQEYAVKNNLQVYIPYGFASGRAGGATSLERQQTWKMVQGSIQRICPEAIIVFREFN